MPSIYCPNSWNYRRNRHYPKSEIKNLHHWKIGNIGKSEKIRILKNRKFQDSGCLWVGYNCFGYHQEYHQRYHLMIFLLPSSWGFKTLSGATLLEIPDGPLRVTFLFDSNVKLHTWHCVKSLLDIQLEQEKHTYPSSISPHLCDLQSLWGPPYCTVPDPSETWWRRLLW